MPSDDALAVFDKAMIIVKNLFSVLWVFSTVFIILFHNLITEAR